MGLFDTYAHTNIIINECDYNKYITELTNLMLSDKTDTAVKEAFVAKLNSYLGIDVIRRLLNESAEETFTDLVKERDTLSARITEIDEVIKELNPTTQKDKISKEQLKSFILTSEISFSGDIIINKNKVGDDVVHMSIIDGPTGNKITIHLIDPEFFPNTKSFDDVDIILIPDYTHNSNSL